MTVAVYFSMPRKPSPARRDENITREPHARVEEMPKRNDPPFEGRRSTDDRTTRKETKISDECSAGSELRRKSADKGKGDHAKKWKGEVTGISEEKKTRLESSVEDSLSANKTTGLAAESKTKRDVQPKSDEKGPRRDTSIHRKSKDNGGHAKSYTSPVDSPNLEAHAEAIHERRMSLPRTIARTDSTGEVEIVIGDDGKPVFHPTITPKAEEILQELTDIVIADEKSEERCPKFIHT